MNLEPGLNHRLWGATGGGIKRPADAASRSAVQGQQEQDNEADRPHGYLLCARDRGAAHHLAISRLAVIDGRAQFMRMPTLLFRCDVPEKWIEQRSRAPLRWRVDEARSA